MNIHVDDQPPTTEPVEEDPKEKLLKAIDGLTYEQAIEALLCAT